MKQPQTKTAPHAKNKARQNKPQETSIAKPTLPKMNDTQDAIQASIGRMEVQLSQWRATLDELISKADRSDLATQLDELKLKYQAAQAKLEQLKGAGNEQWASFQRDIEITWIEIEVAFRKLTN